MSCSIKTARNYLLAALLSLTLAAQGAQRNGLSMALFSAQTARAESNSDSSASANQARALQLLEDLSRTSNGFQDAEVRIRIQALIADAIWDYDQPRARRLFEDAVRGLASIKIPAEDDDSPPATYGGFDYAFKLRSDIFSIIARRDSALAEKIVGLIPAAPPYKPASLDCAICGDQDEPASHLMRLAMSLKRCAWP